MLSIKQCKNEIEKNGERYTDEEIEEIRQILYQLATIQYENSKTSTAENEIKNGISIRKGIDRRTSN